MAAGGNPYRYAPSDPALVALRDERFDRLDHTAVRTIYPPLAQALFGAVAWSGSGRTGLKLILVLCDLGVILLIGRLLAMRRLTRSRALMDAWNPPVLIEVAWSGHLEPAGTALTLLAATAIIQKRDLRAVAALTAASLVKLLPIVLAWVDPAEPLKGAISAVRSAIAATAWLDRLYLYVHPPYLARAVCAAGVVVAAWLIDRRSRDPLRGAFLLLGAILLFSPTVHPWYLLWIVPWLCLYPSRAWLALTGLLVLSYANLGAAEGVAVPYPWIGWVIWLPVYALLAAEWLRRRERLVKGRSMPAASYAPRDSG